MSSDAKPRASGGGEDAPVSDETLMRRLSEGEREALGTLVERYQQDLFRFCMHYVRNVETAQELTQEAFIRLYVARKRFDPARKLTPWLLRIARNLCLNEIKRKKAIAVESLEEFVCGSEGSQDAERLHDAAATADEAAMDHERRRLLARALDSLDDEARELLVLRYFEKMPARGIAETVGSTEGAVRTRIHRILKGLRTEYGPERDNW